MTQHADLDATGGAAQRTDNSRGSNSTSDSPRPSQTGFNASTETPPKKKRKVNHACVYCRRSHMTCDSDRPCKRCIKRNIGHLCHDEPREPLRRKSRGDELDATQKHETGEGGHNSLDETGLVMQEPDLSMAARPSTAQSVLAATGSIGMTPTGLNGSAANRLNFNDQQVGSQNHLHDIHNFHPNFMFNANEISDEYNLLNDFLSTSLFDEAGMFSTEDVTAYSDPSFANSMNVGLSGANGESMVSNQNGNTNLSLNQPSTSLGQLISRPDSVKPPSDKAREKYYMMAADPSGTDSPEERMQKLLKAKYDAGMLKPFNYVGGYARLNKYMEKNMKASSRHKILMQLDRFRPKFRERMQSLTDIELVLVEMWFERSLMEYDRIFASMAIPACCWRRTGEIFRGNKEMAELIRVPIESLREVSTICSV